MLALSDPVRRAIVDGSLVVSAHVDLYRADALLRAGVPLDARDPGSVQVDGTATVLRTCTLNLLADDDAAEAVQLLPLADGPLAPYGNEARVYVALRAPDGTVDTLAQGVFGIRRPQATDQGGRKISVVGRDRSQRVIDATLTAPYDVAPGVNYATAIRGLIDAGVPGLTYVGFDAAGTPYTTLALHFGAGDDRWQRAGEMADSAGKRIYFNVAGEVVLDDVVDPATATTAWDYSEGVDAVVTQVSHALDADNTYSHAVVVSQPTDGHTAPVRSDRYDDDPGSPTYWLGPFGDRPVRMESGYIATQAQADAAGDALLLRKKGLNEDLTLTAMSIYAHEDGDVVQVTRAALGVDDFYVLSRFPIPLGPGQADYTTRSRRVT